MQSATQQGSVVSWSSPSIFPVKSEFSQPGINSIELSSCLALSACVEFSEACVIAIGVNNSDNTIAHLSTCLIATNIFIVRKFISPLDRNYCPVSIHKNVYYWMLMKITAFWQNLAGNSRQPFVIFTQIGSIF